MVRRLFQKPWRIAISLCFILAIAMILFTRYNATFYQTPIGEVTQVVDHQSKHTVDAQHNRDTHYTDKLAIKLLNTSKKGETVQVEHQYNASHTEAQPYHKGDRLLLHVNASNGDAYIVEKKRDTLVVTIVSVFLLSLLIIGERIGLQSIVSLLMNTGAILIAVWLYNQHPNLNLFLLMSLAVTLATILTLTLVIGWQTRTVVTVIATLLGTFICVGIAWLVITFTNSQGIKYETMSFLTVQPKMIFLTSVLVGTLGAVMDVAITISSGMYEILQRTPTISMQRWLKAGQNIGKDIMGTMTNILLFSYLAGGLPMLLLFLKNGNTLTYSISMNWSLEICRALTGGIGIVLTVPLTILFMRFWYEWKGGRVQ
ncbi:YibE/F-like protein [Staphylococcus microti]|uniref:Membrane spanning protein n=1 Tax=Staphylococcus microti TaxID=569857 RepID=A0A0D6XQR1_9STAP|nr:YibE/F family protein [Staphylococcus microti]KIX90912.1 YibE/F-like protein [Staphylococcus microti]SUM58516.1 membrane spanning protein [Staphylococcus microti]